MRSRLAFILTLALLVAAHGVRPMLAQASPQTVARDFFAAIDGRRWREAASLVDPEQLGPYREETLSTLVSYAQRREELRRRPRRGSGALMPLSIDGKLDTLALARVGDMPFPPSPGVRTLRDLAALPPAEFLARYFEAIDPRSDERMKGGVDWSKVRILGAVTDGDSIGHVLYRSEAPGARYDDPYHVQVLATVRRGDRWYVRASRGGAPFGGLAFLMMRLDDLESGRK